MTKKPLKRFWSLLQQYNLELRLIYLYAILIGIVNLTLPLGIQAIINYLQTGEFTSTWVVLVSVVLIGIAIIGFLQVLQLRIVENLQQDLFVKSAFEFSYRIPKINFIQLDKIHAPELVNRFFDTLTIQKGLPKILIDLSVSAFQIFFGLILLAIYSPYFIILGFLLFFILWLIFQITGPKGVKTSLEESNYKYQLAHWLEEVARVNQSFKLNAYSRMHLAKTDDISYNYLNARESHFQVILQQLKLFIGFKVLVAAALLLLGGYLVFQEQMNIGQFVAAEIIIILIINSVEKLLRVIDTIYDVLTALEKIGYVTDLKLDEDAGQLEFFRNGGISIKAIDLDFGFPDEKNKIINQLSFEIPANSRVSLTGPTGSGKTILLQLLSGIYKANKGEILINKVPISNYSKDSLNKHISAIFPTNQIFEGNFIDNICLGREIPDKDLSEVISILQLEGFLAHQPKGIYSDVDSGGRRLPRSIIQKIIIARSIVAKPGLLLLEDPLQFVEEKEKIRIIDYIMDKKHDWTVVIVSDYPYWNERSEVKIVLP